MLLLGNDEGTNPTTTKGDLSTFDTSQQRLPVGSNGEVLSSDSTETTGLKWIVNAPSNPLTTKGDLFTYDSSSARLPLGVTGQILSVDTSESTGLLWVEAGSGSGEVNTASNIGVTGSNIFFQKTGVDFEFKGLVEGNNVTFVDNDDLNVVINAADPGEVNTASNIGVTGSDIFFQKTGVDFEFKGLIAGDNVTFVDNDDLNIIINAADPVGEVNTASNIGVTGSDIFFQKTGVNFEFKGLIAGDNVTFVDNDDLNIIISSTAAGGGTPELIENAGQTASVDVSGNNMIITCGGFERARVGQFGGLAVGASNTDKVAVFTSTASGLVVPRMTETQRDNVTGPLGGEIVFNTTTSKLNVYSGSGWEAITSS